MITESLKATRVGLLKEAQGKYGIRNVCTTDGPIFYNRPGGDGGRGDILADKF